MSFRKARCHLYKIPEFVLPEARWRSECAITLPLSEDDETVGQILVDSLARGARNH